MHYPELMLDNLTLAHTDSYLSSLRHTVQSFPELAEEWVEMDEAEKIHFRLDFTRAFGLRRLLGAMYQANRLTSAQITALTELDKDLLAQAAAVELIYGSTLRQLAHDLFDWGTPLTGQSGTLRIETTITALAELATASS